MKKLFVNDLENYLQERISETFFLRKISAVVNTKTYYKVFLTDKTGEIECRIWQEYIDEKYLEFEGKIVQVDGTVSSYQGQLQITIEKLTLSNYYKAEDFSPIVENIEELKNELFKLIESVKQKHFYDLLNGFFSEDTLLNIFCSRQAGTVIHHAYIGGLLEHTINVAQICDDMSIRYKNKLHEGFNRDLLITAALLHDIGKLKEFRSFPFNKRTVAGRLVGHINYGMAMVYAVTRELNISFPDDDLDKLLHCLLAHHGTIDNTMQAMTTEAVILSRADELDARINAFETFIENDTNNDDFTYYNNVMDLYIYKK